MQLSYVVTCFNLGQYLEECIKSLKLTVGSGSFEIIIINDGSTDKETLNALDRIEEEYCDITVVHQMNQGLGKSRNNGIKIAKGKYIIPVDADNKVRSTMAKRAIEYMERDESIGVVYGNAKFFGLERKIWPCKPFSSFDLIIDNYIDACACFRKSCWNEVGGYDEKMPYMGYEDWDLWLRMLRKDIRFQFADEIFFDYRVRENSMLVGAWQKRQELLDYIFSKPELALFKLIRGLKTENNQLTKNHTVMSLIKILLGKIKDKYF